MAYVTDLGFTMLELGKHKDDGLVRSQVHPEFPNLEIFNYTEEVQFRKKWDKITLACRGLILDTVTGEIVARPWEKFFNLGERLLEIDFNAPVEVTDKMDGSLGILYRGLDGKTAIATRGSFASEQAIHATALWDEEYAMYHDSNEVIDEYTFLFEIIYPENRIVCNYGDMDDLVLLGAVHKQQGYYLGPLQSSGLLGWMGPVTETFDFENFGAVIGGMYREGKEGIVVRSGSKMVKIKQPDYVELHRIVTNLSPRTIWAMIGAGRSIDDICKDIPDEFHEYVKSIGTSLLNEGSQVMLSAGAAYFDIMQELGCVYSRREFAEKAKKSPYAKYLFLLLDGKDIHTVVWDSIRPKGDKTTTEA